MQEVSERDPRTYAIIGAAMEVHRELGCGFVEPVYQEALALEFATREIPYKREVELPVFYKGQKLNKTFRADFICYEEIVVELKAIAKLGEVERAIILNYLNVTGHRVALLINFGAVSLEYERYVL